MELNPCVSLLSPLSCVWLKIAFKKGMQSWSEDSKRCRNHGFAREVVSTFLMIFSITSYVNLSNQQLYNIPLFRSYLCNIKPEFVLAIFLYVEQTFNGFAWLLPCSCKPNWSFSAGLVNLVTVSLQLQSINFNLKTSFDIIHLYWALKCEQLLLVMRL